MKEETFLAFLGRRRSQAKYKEEGRRWLEKKVAF